jgi:hypothetical protein
MEPYFPKGKFVSLRQVREESVKRECGFNRKKKKWCASLSGILANSYVVSEQGRRKLCENAPAILPELV